MRILHQDEQVLVLRCGSHLRGMLVLGAVLILGLWGVGRFIRNDTLDMHHLLLLALLILPGAGIAAMLGEEGVVRFDKTKGTAELKLKRLFFPTKCSVFRLDSVNAKLVTDGKCVRYDIVLLDSGKRIPLTRGVESSSDDSIPGRIREFLASVKRIPRRPPAPSAGHEDQPSTSTSSDDLEEDPLAIREYDVNVSIYSALAYVIPLAGVIILQWSVALFFVTFFFEMLFYLLGLMVYQKIVTNWRWVVLATILLLPLIIASAFLASLAYKAFCREGNMLQAFLFSAVSIGSLAKDNIRRFRKTKLKWARFYRHINQKYASAYDPERPLFGPASFMANTLIFAYAAGVTYLLVASLTLSENRLSQLANLAPHVHASTVKLAVAITVLKLAWDFLVAAIMRSLYRGNRNDEDIYIHQLTKSGQKLILRARQPTDVSGQ